MRKIQVCLIPSLFKLYDQKDKVIVIVDIFRATSIICTMFMNGASKVIPVESLEIAKRYKDKGFLVAAERNGKKIDFADFGNSPFEFTLEKIQDKTIVYSTTNGTQTINLCNNNEVVLIGSFLNISALANYLINLKKDVIILCSGWEGDFCLEDMVFAGALSEKLIKSQQFCLYNDAAVISMDNWSFAKSNIENYLKKSFQYKRLEKLGMVEIIRYCLTLDETEVIPVYIDNCLVLK
ncbi:MAG: 2-phosphosulfolactate phosphatase [Bacteroidales bacterium]|jgi:2-phosphosulfolactate phosphatase|nr:2-phosphosulfolactate phosphatase [Bacteroidales bacterium]